MPDKKLENLGVQYQRQYNLLKGVIETDKKMMCDSMSNSVGGNKN